MVETGSLAFEHLPIASAIVETGDPEHLRVTGANHAMTKLTGLPREALLGIDLLQLVGGEDLRSRLQGYEIAENGVVALCAGPGGQKIPVVIRGNLVPNPAYPTGLAVVTLRETTQRHTRKALRESNNRLQQVADNVTALIYLKGADGRYFFANHHFEQLVQLAPGEIYGRDDYQVWPQNIADAYVDNDHQVLMSGQPLEFEEPIPNPDGSTGMWLSLKFPLRDESGKVYGTGGISTDISDRNRVSIEIASAKEEAERANHAKSEFLSRMSHELRTPLNSIIGFTQLMQTEHGGNDESLGRILQAGHHLLSLINQILEFSRIESGSVDVALSPVNACDPLAAAIDMVRPIAAARSIDVSCDYHAAIYQHVLANSDRLQQVLLNVLLNAVNYNNIGGLIRVTTRRNADVLRIRVEDTGHGMSHEDVSRIFVPFERLEGTRSTVEGTGLGLALSKDLVEAMGGRLGVERTAPGQGSVFFVDLQLTDGGDPVALPSDAKQVDDQSPLDLRDKSILYIEDNPDNAELITQVFARYGQPFLEIATDGAGGLAAATERPDLILLDMHLPDIDGEQILAILKSREDTKDIPVLLLSADANPDHVDRFTDLGAVDYLTKPIDIPELLQSVRTAMRSQ
ncbi:ATP-binding protein [Rhodococcus zopfii]|uniref:ATP-binding protein n=1 Tax=Rhodococcus zopfii TaxID=43772 RepID=UPI0011115047|nr:ATP-binding protein [Rhodococcus zopfii]